MRVSFGSIFITANLALSGAQSERSGSSNSIKSCFEENRLQNDEFNNEYVQDKSLAYKPYPLMYNSFMSCSQPPKLEEIDYESTINSFVKEFLENKSIFSEDTFKNIIDGLSSSCHVISKEQYDNLKKTGIIDDTFPFRFSETDFSKCLPKDYPSKDVHSLYLNFVDKLKSLSDKV